MPVAGTICATIKGRDPELKVLLVGGHVAALPERTLREEAADFVSGGEGPHTILDLLQALKSDLHCEFANFYSAVAYPGSHLYAMAVKESWPLPEKWTGYSQHSVDTLPLPTKYLSGAEVLSFRDHAFQVYFNNPRYLDIVARKFGPETAQHIREMASHKLVRG